MIAGLAGMAVPGTLFAARSGGGTGAEKLIVSGRILRADGKPLAGAKVEALNARAHGGSSVTTDADGRFVFATLAPAGNSPRIHYQVSHAEHGTLARQLYLGRAPGVGSKDVAQLQRGRENVAQLQRDEAGTWRAAFGLTLT